MAYSNVEAIRDFKDAKARPFYNIAHMVNSRYQLDEWLSYGANAIENDVAFAEDGTPRYFYHGVPCDALRFCSRWDYVKPYIEAVRERVEPNSPKFNPKFTLLMFDLKVRKLRHHVLERAGRKLVDVILKPLFTNSSGRLKSVLYVQDERNTDIIKGVLNRVNETNPEILFKIGFDVENSSAMDLESLHRIPAGHFWLSNGASNWFVPLMQGMIKKHLVELVAKRDSGEAKESKVYSWTIDHKWTIQSYLETGLDAIVTNRPQNVNEAIAEFNRKSNGLKFRLATLDDDPFKNIRFRVLQVLG